MTVLQGASWVSNTFEFCYSVLLVTFLPPGALLFLPKWTNDAFTWSPGKSHSKLPVLPCLPFSECFLWHNCSLDFIVWDKNLLSLVLILNDMRCWANSMLELRAVSRYFGWKFSDSQPLPKCFRIGFHCRDQLCKPIPLQWWIVSKPIPLQWRIVSHL